MASADKIDYSESNCEGYEIRSCRQSTCSAPTRNLLPISCIVQWQRTPS